MKGRRQKAEASDQYTEGILLSAQAVCIVAYCIKCASNLHSYICVRLLVSSYQVRNVIALLPIVSSMQSDYIVGIISSTQYGCIVTYVVILSSTQYDYIVGIISSTQSDYIVTYVIKGNNINVRNMLTILYLCHIFYIV